MALGRWTFPTSRKQSTASSSGNRTNGASTPSDFETQDSSKSQFRLLRSLTGGFKSPKAKKTAEQQRDECYHLNKPFTPQNLEHQKILGAFEWNFGRRRKSSHGGRSSMSGISPSTSRNASVDRNHTALSSSPTETHHRFSHHKPPRDNKRGSSG
ncbi:uncharacterized protein GGS25DRAFT_106456 [Hypoxylon fragiforme]|uniref:uncharacterized protein n=1 Tax=Hypoxylon fragiforme TaxID=63214 RepID=UPI0020C712E0|nr:uncharacterized protein GGS25DRAFT_101219 [Hypoxylon fragiforme]XP_049119676.1 uncharacterized protein GGS25DRAFT_106456 [Hypoxylon fragiforme]KAI2602704.1 hypothetical protein GGS25DRAFT_101219 [Hypoxylon fragiforme]KAI2612111.1 hypothetical protein GGS25DRAFT_106456 [Hypoxylon fragiforme]